MVEIALPSDINTNRLRNFIFGNDISLSREKAVSLLLASNYQDKLIDCKILLESPKESVNVRYAAAISLGDINSPLSRDILLKNTDIQDKQVLEGVILSIGRAGDEKSIDAVLKVAKTNSGHIAKQAKFAASLISYRLGLDGNELPSASQIGILTVQSDSRSIQITPTEEDSLRRCFLSLKDNIFGITLSDSPSYQLKLGKEDNIILLNSDILNNGGIKILFEKKAILGVVGQYNEETGEYYLGYLILTSPTSKGKHIDILFARPHGKISFGGTASIDDNNEIEFTIQSLSEVGIFPLKIEGIIHDNKLQIKNAEFSAYRTKREPVRV